MFPKGIHGASTPAHLVSQVTAELLTLTVPLNEVGTGHREPPHKGRSRERTQPSGSPAEHSPCDSVKPACSPCPSPLVPETPRQMMQEPVDRGGVPPRSSPWLLSLELFTAHAPSLPEGAGEAERKQAGLTYLALRAGQRPGGESKLEQGFTWLWVSCVHTAHVTANWG